MITARHALASNQFFYFGVAPTYNVTSFNWTNYNQTLVNTVSSQQVGLFLGYGVLVDYIYLGFEGGAQLGKRTTNKNFTNYDSNTMMNYKAIMSDIYIFDFRPGFVWRDKNSMFYGILGLNSANFNLEQKDRQSNQVIANTGSIRRNGLRVGLGYNLGLSRYIMARVEYIYTKFSKFDGINNNDVDEDNQVQDWQLNPYSNEISLGLAFVVNI